MNGVLFRRKKSWLLRPRPVRVLCALTWTTYTDSTVMRGTSSSTRKTLVPLGCSVPILIADRDEFLKDFRSTSEWLFAWSVLSYRAVLKHASHSRYLYTYWIRCRHQSAIDMIYINASWREKERSLSALSVAKSNNRQSTTVNLP